jgi:carboxymethylenebutenolidase
MKMTLRIFKWGILAVVGLVLLVGLVFAAVVLLDKWFPSHRAAQYANVQLTAKDGTPLNAYLAQPPGEGPYPAVLLLHEWWGLNEDIVAKADALATAGYVVLAPDAWRGISTRSIPHALWLVSTQPQARIADDLDVAFDYLAQQDDVDGNRIASLGFCFGGSQSLQLGLRQPQLAATILFYGQLVTDPAELVSLKDAAPVLGIFAAEDFSISVEDVYRFDEALTELGIEHQVSIYPDVSHGFANQEQAITSPGPAADAWQETLEFLDTHLKSS